MTKCQQYFVTDPSRSVDFQKQETDSESTAEENSVPSLRTVAFTKEGSEEVSGPTVADGKNV